MNPSARLTILFDCCHSGSACELPFVYRPDADGNVNLLDTIRKGKQLVSSAQQILSRGFSSPTAVDDAKMLLGGATDFFNSLGHRGEGDVDEDGLSKENFEENWEGEGKDVWMFSGCADDQTSADTKIAGSATGAMSWAFIGAMRENPEYSYIEVSLVFSFYFPCLLSSLLFLVTNHIGKVHQSFGFFGGISRAVLENF
jgi:hypothetical protein